MAVLPTLLDVLVWGIAAALAGATAGIGGVQVVTSWAPTGAQPAAGRWLGAAMALLAALLGVVASTLALALVLFTVVGSGWVWLPAGVVTITLALTHLTSAVRARDAAELELTRPTWRARWEDSVVVARWFRESFGRRGPLAMWAALPGVLVVVVSAGWLVRDLASSVADPGQLPWYGPALLVVGVLVATAAWALAGAADPKSALTRALLAPPPRRWRDAQLARQWSSAASARSVDRALRRRERRLASSTRRRYADARGVLVEVLLLAEEAGYSAQPPRNVHRDALRVGLRLAVAGDPQAALLAYERWRSQWGLHHVVPGELSRWSIRRILEVVGVVSAVGGAVVLLIGLAARLLSAAQAGSLIDGLNVLR